MDTADLDEFAKRIRDVLQPENENSLPKKIELGNELSQGVEDAVLMVKAFKPVPEELDEPEESEDADVGSFPEIDDYRIIRQIGKGGMGVVFEARQISLDRQVALKLLPGRYAKDETALRRFQREAKSAAALHHSNVVPVFDIGQCNGHHYYAMQLILGKPLTEIIAEIKAIREGSDETKDTYAIANSILDGDFSVDHFVGETSKNAINIEETLDATRVDSGPARRAVQNDTTRAGNSAEALKRGDTREVASETNKIVRGLDDTVKSVGDRRQNFFHEVAQVGRQVANALAYAHDNGVIHRDIKPANLLMDYRGNVWVADFGLAKTDEEDLTRTGDVVGTLRYMSPERFSGECTESGDIYALGATLYELALQKPGFEQADYLKLIDAIANKTPTKPRQVEPTIPADLETIILKSMEKDPRRRYVSAQALSDDLLRFVEGRPINARYVSLAERSWIWARRNPVVSGLAAALCVIGLLTLVASVIAAATFRNMAVTQKKLANEAKASSLESQKNLAQLQKEKARGDLETEKALAVNSFLLIDILGQAETSLKYEREFRADPDLTIRTALDRASKRAGKVFAERPLIECDIRETLGNAYRSVGAYSQSAKELERSLELARRHFDEDDSSTYVIQHNMALSLDLCDFDKRATRNFEEAMEGLIRLEGPEHTNSLSTMTSVAFQRYAEFKLQESRELFEKVIKISEAAYGVNCPSSLNAKRGLSTVLSETGHAEEAIALAEVVAMVYSEQLGADHLKAIDARINLGIVLAETEQMDKAIEILEESYEAVGVQRGRTHPDTLSTLEDLAGAYREIGRFDTAISLKETVLKELRKQFSDQTETVLFTMNGLVDLYREVGRYEDAAEFSEHVRTCRKNALGMEDERTLSALYNHAALLRDTGELDEAADLLRQVLDGRRKALGNAHDNTLKTISSLANVLRATGKMNLAIKYLEQTLELRTEKYGPEQVDTLSVMSNLAGALRESGNPQKAIEILEQARRSWKKQFDDGHPDMLPTLNNLAVAYSDVGRNQESIQLQREVYGFMKKAWGDDHRDTLNSLANIGVGLWKLGKLDESIPIFEEVVQRQGDTLGRDHPKTLVNVANLGVNYRDAGRLDEAIPLFEEAYRGSKEYFRLRWIGTPLLTAYARTKSEKALPLADELLKEARSTLDPDGTDYAEKLFNISDAFLLMNEHERIIETLEKPLEIYRAEQPDDWFVGAIASRLGNSLRVKKRFDEAKELLLEAHQAVKNDSRVPTWVYEQVLNRLVLLYKDLDDQTNVEKWRARLTTFKKQSKG